MAKLFRRVSLAAAMVLALPFLGAVPSAAPAAAALTPAQQLASLSMAQRVGQLFMVAAGATGADATTMGDLANYHVGNVYLAGRSNAGINATLAVVRKMTSTVSQATTGGEYLTVATDQEGGNVQVLNGPGISAIPTALVQGGKLPAVLTADAKVWGTQLRWSGLTLDLAPVLDTVPSAAFAPHNPPIGYYQREYGYTPQAVSSEGNAFAAGLKQAYVAPAIKHFPGLGRVTLNTDTSSNVHDTLTTIHDPYLLPYQTAINDGVRWVMVSSAYYDKIDPAHIGPQSQIIMRTMLRTNAKFTGVILSDDLCNAVQLSPWSLGVRAADFFNAGGTMALCANPADLPAMYNYVVNLAAHNPTFAAEVNAAALTVLTVKAGH